MKTKLKKDNKSSSSALVDYSAIVVRLKMTGSKKNKAKVRAFLRREIADMLHAKDGPWPISGEGGVDIEWLVISSPKKVI